jgi:hypothetical protein
VTLTLEERVEQLKARIAGFKLRYPHLYPPPKPKVTPPSPKPTPQNTQMNDLRAKLRGKS